MNSRCLALVGLGVLLASITVPLAKNSKKTIKVLSLPGKEWSLLIDLPKFKILERETLADESETRILAINRKTDVIVSVYLERDPEFSSKVECRDCRC